MSIPRSYPIKDINDRLSNLETCAEHAPEGVYEQAKDVARLVGDLSNTIIEAVREAGLTALNDDRLRVVEAAIYGYVLEGNENVPELISAEGFGEAMHGPERDRVLEQSARDRDALRALVRPSGPSM